MKTEYVLCFAHSMPSAMTQQIVVIERTKDDWQKGRLNLPGGKVHMGYETVEEAAARELTEETGISPMKFDIRKLGVLEGPDWLVHVMWVPYQGDYNRNEPRTAKASEGVISKLYFTDVLNDERLLPELKIIIPMCMARLEGWRIMSDPGQAKNEFQVFA